MIPHPMRRAWASVVALAACQGETPPGQTYFARVISPILDQSCSRGSSGCHAADPEDPSAFASGNLDLTSHASLMKRPDVLRGHGAYPVPFLLAKAVGETSDLRIVYKGQQLPMQIPHAGGAVFSVGSPAFLTLQAWLAGGAREDGVRQPPAPVAGTGPCSPAVPADFDEAALAQTPQFQAQAGAFEGVQRILSEASCNAGNCHGATQSDFYLTCGDDARQRAFNFRQVWAFVADPVDRSDVLWLPVSGGAQHAGGAHFSGPEDPDYRTIAAFAAAVGPMPAPRAAPQQFFEDRVMPVLLSRGCAAEGCHSPAAMNDFKMRGGSPGFFSPVSLEKNYHIARDDFMALEVPDVRRSRLVAKNLFPANGGIAHRGGPLLEVGGGAADPAACGAYDPATASPFCTLVEWARLERAAIGAPNAGERLPIVYVERDGQPSLLDPGGHFPGDLRVADATVTNGRVVPPLTGARSLLGGCGAADPDVRAPDVAHDGRTVVFAMRPEPGADLQLWTVDLDGEGCRPLLAEPGVQNLDPAWSPDGEWIVYASTRAGGSARRRGTDLWRVRAAGGAPERMTFLSSSEIGPQFMREGRVTMTTEKIDARDPQGGFYQLAGRRINWDLTDYHPLLAQRARSPIDPAQPATSAESIGFKQATEIREGLDGNFLLVVSDPPASAGAIAIFNRSIGPFERGRSDPGFLASVKFLDGTYRSPFPLPDGRILAAHAADGADFDLVAVDPVSGQRQVLLGATRAQVEAVAALAHPPRRPYLNRRQLVFGGAADGGDPAHAVVHIPDAPMLATLLGSNLRRGRNPAAFRAADRVGFLDADGQLVGSAMLAEDGSVRVRAPAGVPLYLGLFTGSAPLFVMSEEHQFGPGERISLGVREAVFDQVCGGCHGSVSGREIDIGVSPDALTGASESLSRTASPVPVGP
jgi:hypothetical protein